MEPQKAKMAWAIRRKNRFIDSGVEFLPGPPGDLRGPVLPGSFRGRKGGPEEGWSETWSVAGNAGSLPGPAESRDKDQRRQKHHDRGAEPGGEEFVRHKDWVNGSP